MNKLKAYMFLNSLEIDWYGDNIKSTAVADVQYMISLGWIAYSSHIEKVLLEGYCEDTPTREQYQKAIAEIHQKLIDNNVFK